MKTLNKFNESNNGDTDGNSPPLLTFFRFLFARFRRTLVILLTLLVLFVSRWVIFVSVKSKQGFD